MSETLDSSFTSGVNYFPYQKRSESQKSDKYYKDCIDAGISLINWHNDTLNRTSTRPTFKNKIINYNLYNDVVDEEEAQRVVNPRKLQGVSFPVVYRNYPLMNPNINILLGEERKRFYEPVVIVLDDDAVTDYQEAVRAQLDAFLLENLIDPEADEEQMQRQLQKIEKWKNWEYKDLRARMGTQVLRYLYKTLDLKEMFSRGFADLLIAAESIYVTDIVGGEPIARKGDPLCFHTIRSGSSFKIEDSEIIVEDGYLPVGEVIDRYYDYLTPKQIDIIEKGFQVHQGAKRSLFERSQLLNEPIKMPDLDINTILMSGSTDTFHFGGGYDGEGNVRVTRVLWKGMRKVLKLRYYDIEEGEWVEDLMPEGYEPDKERGETVETLWISEWYEGTKIANQLEIKTQPRPVQIRSMDNLSKAHPGIVGTVFNVNTGKGRSIMDLGRDLQLLYNVFMFNTEKAFAKYKGKIARLPLHLIPDGWNMDRWIYYAEELGWAAEDAFREGKQGVARGKLAGHMNEKSPVIDMEMGNYIQNHIMMLDFIKRRADDVCGITDQRKGAIDNRETVGGVERAVMQSSLITETWFSAHDDTKTRVMRCLLETAKVAWRGKSIKRQFVLDDGTVGILDVDGDLIAETNYGIDVGVESDVTHTLQKLESIAQFYAQAGAPMSLVAELYTTKSPTDLKRKIQRYEDEMEEQRHQEMEAQREAEAEARELQMQQIELENELRRVDQEIQMYKIDADNATRIQVATIQAQSKDTGGDSAMAYAEQALREREESSKEFSQMTEQARKEKELKIKERAEQKKAELEEKKINLEKEKLKVAEKIQKMKDEAAMKRERLKSKTALRNPTGAEAARGKKAPSKVKLGN